MIERLDQLFVILQQWIVGFLPERWQPAAAVILGVVFVPALVAWQSAESVARVHRRLTWQLCGRWFWRRASRQQAASKAPGFIITDLVTPRRSCLA